MAWGQSGAGKGVEDWVPRLLDNDPKLTSITVFRTRRFDRKEVQELCSALEGNTTLTELTAGSHSISAADAEAFAGVLRSNSALKSLCVGNSSFGDNGMAVLAEGLAANSALEHLDLGNKGLGVAGARALQHALVARKGLHRLVISGNQLGDEGAEAFAPAVPLIQELEAHDCGIGSTGIQSWVGAAIGPGRPAASVEASPEAESIGHEAAAGSSAVGQNRLRILHLDGNALGAAGASALAPLLGRLEEAYLGSSSLGDEGARELAGALTPSCSLRLLDVNHNGIGPAGARALADAIQGGSPLRVLRLRGNAIGDEGVSALGRALAAQPPLEELDVGNNQIGAAAADLLRTPSRLRKLSLFAARLGSGGARDIADRLSEGGFLSLMELELSACDIGTDGMVRLFAVLEAQAAPALEMLVIGGQNPALEEDGFEGRVEALWAARPDLDVAWRVGDAASLQQLGGAPAVDLSVEG